MLKVTCYKDLVNKLARRDLLSQRFNLFLTSSQLQFVKQKGEELGLGASDYLRSLIDAQR